MIQNLVGGFGLGCLGWGVWVGLWVLVSGWALSHGFWCQTLCSVDEVWVKQDYANLSDTERRVRVGRIERICLTPSGEFGWDRIMLMIEW